MKNKIKEFGVANTITVARIFLIPIFLYILLGAAELNGLGSDFFPGWRPIIAALFFSFIALTDSLDGYIARLRNEVTVFGKLIDPLADKLLVSAALLALVQMGEIQAWTAFVVISREFIVSGIRMVASAEGLVVAASKWGKLKTLLQVGSIALLIGSTSSFVDAFSPGVQLFINYFVHGLWWLAVLITVGSMIDYFYKTAPIINKSWKV